jgi:hypothetical protein
MPIKEAACYECKTVEDLLVRMSDVLNPPPVCPVCNSERRYLVSAPQKTAGKWGDQTGKFGVNGFYDRGLGATYYNNDQRDRIAKSKGYEKEAPYDKILASASAEKIPEKWKKQLKTGGRIVVPIGDSIWLFIKKNENEFFCGKEQKKDLSEY